MTYFSLLTKLIPLCLFIGKRILVQIKAPINVHKTLCVNILTYWLCCNISWKVDQTGNNSEGADL